MPNLHKLKYQCKRGSKELDLLLEGFLLHHFASATPLEQQLFAELLAMPNALLFDYLLANKPPPSMELRQLVSKITDNPTI